MSIIESKNKVGAVLVLGGGIAGIQTSLDLAELGFKVFLVESSSAIGGIMSQLDKTFPTNDCAMCILSPKLVEVGRHPNIQIITQAEIEKVEGTVGNFNVMLKKYPRYINEDKCTGCGLCSSWCPIETLSEYDEGLRKRKSIYIKYPQAIPKLPSIDRTICLGCRLCEYICEARAIDFAQKEELIPLNVGSIIIAQGSTLYNPLSLKQYGYGRFPNVITSSEFERILSASGPFIGHVLRPSDGKVPEKLAWIQCIGSRDRRIGNDYCSAVCCMYAIKEAIIAKEHESDIDCHIFFIDIRAYGKGFEEYYQRAQELGIKFLRGKIALIDENPHTKNLIIAYENTETGKVLIENFDMVVLSIGLQPSNSIIDLSKKLGVNLNKYNFYYTNIFNPMETNKPGIFVCGTCSGPKDIPETVAEASGAAGKVSSLLSTERNTLTTIKEYPPEVPIENQEARIGVFICHCGINIGGIVNVPEVVEFTKTLPNVVYTEENLYTCSQDTQDKIKQIIKEHKLNRIVVASCTPRTHESLFHNTIREAGLNPYLFELTNIREQCSWVHMSKPEDATEKAKDLVAMNVSKAELLEPIYETSVEVTNSGLVIGGGIAGMNAALELANQDFDVYLIEKEKELGGFVRKIHYLLEGGDPQEYLGKLINQILNHDKIKIFTNATIEDIQGFVGNFLITVNQNGEKKQLDSGVIIVATGGTEYIPMEYMYGKDERILTQQELEQKIVLNEVDAKTVVMIQCVGSRNEKRPNCNRICCSVALKNALKLKEKYPNINICILYRDVRTYGFKEDYYREAREKGVIFIRYDEKLEPEVNIINSKLMVTVNDSCLNEQIVIKPDLIVLSAAFLPTENKELSQMLKVPLEQNGFFLEAHVKLRPLDFATDGIFLCGTAQWPKFINETIAQAKGAAARAGTILSKEKMKIIGSTAEIEEEKCIGCGECRDTCIYDAIEVIETISEFKAILDSVVPSVSLIRYKSRILPALCKGCGSCEGVCPVGAISLKHFTNQQLTAMVQAYLR
ncbi:MAG: FAD-dependent oxidoreductase [Promethearchaeota archaeon]